MESAQNLARSLLGRRQFVARKGGPGPPRKGRDPAAAPALRAAPEGRDPEGS